MSMKQKQDRIIEEFCSLDDWLDRYDYLINLGKELKPLESRFKTDENALPGCQSQVWIHAEKEDGKLFFRAESDSDIINGILMLLIDVLDESTPSEVAEADLYFVREMGLSTSLSPSRSNGLASIVRYVKLLGSENQ
ncbi:MAG: SufE family protein [Chitinispirillaceae bacterium]